MIRFRLSRGGIHSRYFLFLAVFFVGVTALADEDRQGAFKLPGRNFVLPVRPPASNADPANPNGPTDVITQRNNNHRTGTVVQRGMNQASVSDGRFGLVASLPVDGAVLAQPLFMETVPLSNGRRSVIFIATSTNWVYAFDANPPFKKLWEKNLGKPLRIDNPWTLENRERGTVLMTLTQDVSELPLSQQSVVIGIESTPAIDPALGRLLISYRSAEGAPTGIQRIAALDIRTGDLVKGSDGIDLNFQVTDDPDNPDWNWLHRNRASLLIDNGLVYVGYSALNEGEKFGFDKSYQGWIYAFDVRTLEPAGRFRTTQVPVGVPPRNASNDPVEGGGIWQGSTGMAADNKGNIYFSTGNARPNTPARPDRSRIPDALGKNLSNSVIKLHIDCQSGTLQRACKIETTPADWFTPYRKLWQDKIDLDFGSAGVVLIPNTRYLAMAGKEGMLYVLNRNDLGKFDSTPPFELKSVEGKTTADAEARDDPDRDRVVQKFQVGINQYCERKKKALFCSADPKLNPETPNAGVTMDDWIAWPHIHGTPVFGAFPDGRAFLYIWPEKDHLKYFPWWGGGLEPKPALATRLPSNRALVLAPPYLLGQIGAVGMPGGMLSLTIDPSQSAGGVLFASAQRCRKSKDERDRKECDVSLCAAAVDNCREQRFGMLRAFDPITLRELWNNQADRFANDDEKNYWFAKFVPPTIAKGRVYLATASKQVLVYGRR